MIPSHWFRRIVLVLFFMEVGGGILWVATRLAPDPAYKPFMQTVAGLIFLFGFYASAPLAARFLAPVASTDGPSQRRLAGVLASMPVGSPVYLYDHADRQANTVGLGLHHSRIYLTSGLVCRLSDPGLRGVIAHEESHIAERHILGTFAYASCFTLGSYGTNNNIVFIAGFLIFLALRRYFEYRADAGAAARVGKADALAALHELHEIYPSRPWHRWISFLTAYPTLPMRIRALETGRMTLV